MRVVSLLPSATEILLSVTGAADDPRATLVGRSHECDYPVNLGHVPVLTAQRTCPGGGAATAAEVDRQVCKQVESGQSLYTLDTDLLAALKPDLILTQDLCSVCSIDLNTVRALVSTMRQRPEVLSLNPTTIEGVFDDFLNVGRAVGMEIESLKQVIYLRQRMYRAEEFVTPYLTGYNVAFLEWSDPLFMGGHWTPQLIERAGGHHPLNPTTPIEGSGAAAGPVGQTMRAAGKSVRLPSEVLVASQPEVIVVCPCGLTLEQGWQDTANLSRAPWWKSLPAVRNHRVAVVDGNQMFNRPGPRLVDAFEFLVGYLNDRPDLIPVGFPWRMWDGR